LREYLTQVTTDKLGIYIEHCISSSFTKSGLVFQDLVNELGRRLDYKVLNGRYQGTTNSIGYDGVWRSPEGHTIVAEVKTADAVKLDTIATYRAKLLEANNISNPASNLIIVGRQDTGELEAQIRGSRHAWDIRLISADALLKLVQLKENSDDPETGLKIRSLLTPMEFTRLDGLVDVMFSTATDVESNIVQAALEKVEAISEQATESETTSGWQFTNPAILDKKRNDIIDAMSKKVNATLVRHTRALYWDASHENRIACSISKRYSRGGHRYWYAYHPKWNEFLKESKSGYFVLGCVDLNDAFAIPVHVVQQLLDKLNTTTTERSTYWHIHLTYTGSDMCLVIPGATYLSLDDFRIILSK